MSNQEIEVTAEDLAFLAYLHTLPRPIASATTARLLAGEVRGFTRYAQAGKLEAENAIKLLTSIILELVEHIENEHDTARVH